MVNESTGILKFIFKFNTENPKIQVIFKFSIFRVK